MLLVNKSPKSGFPQIHVTFTIPKLPYLPRLPRLPKLLRPTLPDLSERRDVEQEPKRLSGTETEGRPTKPEAK